VTWALVPARSFRTGKSRLGRGPARAAIARALFDRVVGVAASALDGVLVCTDGADVAAAARAHGAEVLLDDGPMPLGRVVDRGLAALPAGPALVVMADLPLLGPSHLEDLVAALDAADLALAPDRDQLGTNALALRVPAGFATCFGNTDSFPRHLAAARARGLTAVAVRSHGLAFDVDTRADLDELVAAAPPLEAPARIRGQRFVRTERRRRVTDTVERIARIVHAPVQRGPLRDRPPSRPRDSA
jgi:2-phospho-L-lactate guanylyltransferase